jgi:hypothetical protein
MLAAVVAAIAAVCVTSTAGRAAGVPAPADSSLGPAAGIAALPPELSAPIAASGRVVSAIAADIDADGDLDVIATDGSLNLMVWVNDGEGHLTPQHPRRSTAWDAEPPSPSLDDRSPSIPVTTHVAPSPVGGRPAWSGRAEAPTPHHAADSLGWAPSHLRTPRVPRAPPSTILLA